MNINETNINKIVAETTNEYLKESLSQRWTNAKHGFNVGRQAQKNGQMYNTNDFDNVRDNLNLSMEYIKKYINYFASSQTQNKFLLQIKSALDELYQELRVIDYCYYRYNSSNNVIGEGLGNRLRGFVHGLTNGKSNEFNGQIDNTNLGFNKPLRSGITCCKNVLTAVNKFVKTYKSYSSAKNLLRTMGRLKNTILYINNQLNDLLVELEDDLSPAYNKIKGNINQQIGNAKGKYKNFIDHQKELMAQERAEELARERQESSNDNEYEDEYEDDEYEDDDINNDDYNNADEPPVQISQKRLPRKSKSFSNRMNNWGNRIANSKFGRFIQDVVNED